ncbi:hypothetical protein T459_26189 [Capsicum annuum]|uniref:Uncharacterized protein n=1 Tax=Capsicum annuum TaxID=4072 RepID=A0A2G2YN11_CAPAN|nr:hypothetical protein T459_26189 [Capsicum annuum]
MLHSIFLSLFCWCIFPSELPCSFYRRKHVLACIINDTIAGHFSKCIVNTLIAYNYQILYIAANEDLQKIWDRPHYIYQYWERVCLVYIGEQAVIPEGISKHVHAAKYLIAGGVAGATSHTVTAPFDLLKVILQVWTARISIGSTIREIWKDGGVLRCFRGNGLNVMEVAPESAIKFYSYEMLKNIIACTKGKEQGDIEVSGRLVAGGMAGGVAQTAIYPMDLVQTRLQTHVSEGGKVPSLEIISKEIWMKEGHRDFYKGLVPSLLGIIPYAGIDLAAYETLKDLSRIYILHDSEPCSLMQLGCGTISGVHGAAGDFTKDSDSGLRLYYPSRLFEPDVSTQYLKWWIKEALLPVDAFEGLSKGRRSKRRLKMLSNHCPKPTISLVGLSSLDGSGCPSWLGPDSGPDNYPDVPLSFSPKSGGENDNKNFSMVVSQKVACDVVPPGLSVVSPNYIVEYGKENLSKDVCQSDSPTLRLLDPRRSKLTVNMTELRITVQLLHAGDARLNIV